MNVMTTTNATKQIAKCCPLIAQTAVQSLGTRGPVPPLCDHERCTVCDEAVVVGDSVVLGESLPAHSSLERVRAEATSSCTSARRISNRTVSTYRCSQLLHIVD